MRSIILFLATILISFVIIFYSCGQSLGPAKKIVAEQQFTKKYTCTMHPEVITDKPGNCPKCGMELVEMKAESKVDTTNQMKHESKCPRHNGKMGQDSTKEKKCGSTHNSSTMSDCCK